MSNSAVERLQPYLSCRGVVIDTPSGGETLKAQCPNGFNYFILISCEGSKGYAYVCLNDDGYKCIKKRVGTGMNNVKAFYEALIECRKVKISHMLP